MDFAKPLMRTNSMLVELVRDLVFAGDCYLDHHGHCQEHGWLEEGECPHARAQRFLAAVDAANEAGPCRDGHLLYHDDMSCRRCNLPRAALPRDGGTT